MIKYYNIYQSLTNKIFAMLEKNNTIMIDVMFSGIVTFRMYCVKPWNLGLNHFKPMNRFRELLHPYQTNEPCLGDTCLFVVCLFIGRGVCLFVCLFVYRGRPV